MTVEGLERTPTSHPTRVLNAAIIFLVRRISSPLDVKLQPSNQPQLVKIIRRSRFDGVFFSDA